MRPTSKRSRRVLSTVHAQISTRAFPSRDALAHHEEKDKPWLCPAKTTTRVRVNPTFNKTYLSDKKHTLPKNIRIARAFWSGKLTKNRRASVLTALFSSFDERYKIYEDTDDMAIFYD